ncbi:MAG TPA: PBP1A family penicillin-binding protein [Thermoanaerobaculia bacterium]|nr:PBP1A family penicillin-binding protein [Thermoanaerobaculia bacterium]
MTTTPPEEPPATPPPSPTPRAKRRLPTRRTIFRTISISALVLFVAFAALALWVYKESVGKFEVRRLRLPTRIYADYTPLTPGAPLQKDDLLEKLDRLGYRESPALSQAGDFASSKEGIDIYTRAFSHPSGEYASQPLRVTFKGATIDTVVSLREARPLDKAALEPELLTSILSESLENRRPVTLDQVPKHLQDAVVVTEDVRFWHHPGVDPFGILRAVFRNLRAHGVSEGASTLTQQLVKNYYLTSERTMKRKVVEAFMAVILDARYSKREILEAYLNDIYLGRNRSISILGVGEASRFYFGKPVADINIAEAALLAGMIRSPNNYSPFTHPESALKRRNTVLQLLLKEKKIDQATYQKAHDSKLPTKPFRQKTGLSSIPYYVDRVLQEMQRDYGIDDVKGRGLQIYTAIDLSAQDTAARTLENSLRGLEKNSRRLRRSDNPLQGALVHVDVPTGEIRALVGGRSYELSQFNRALKSKRLVGSLFKPFVYLTAFEPSLSNQNITPATVVSDTRFVLKRRFSSDWSPGNYDNAYHGNVTVAYALEESMNSASVRIGLACGIAPILKTAQTLGVQTELDDSNPSILLGATGIPPIEMADAYSTIARQGSRIPLRTIRFVTDDRGRVLSAGDDIKPVQVFPQRDVYLITQVMRNVVDHGTAAGSRGMGFRKIAAGKTGTTNDKRDAWFIGFTPQTLTATWVGFDDNAPMGLSGSDAAVPMWTRYMLAVTPGQPDSDFPAPPGVVIAEFDKTSGGLPTPYCPRNLITRAAFKAGTEPQQPCPLHSGQVAPTTAPMFDEFGNPITATATTSTTTPIDTGLPPTDGATLTGGFGRTDTGAPPPPPTATQQEPPPTTDTEEQEPPPPSTDTTTTT